MAALSSAHSVAFTPPAEGRGAWNFSVPLSEEEKTFERPPYAPDQTPMVNSSSSPQYPQQHTTSTRPAQRRTNTIDSQNSGRSLQHQASGHFRSNRLNTLSRKQSDLSAGTSDPDGFGDLYKEPGQVRNGASGAMVEKRKASSNGAIGTVLPKDDSKWIHRDKLAQIESKELEEAGFRVPRQMSRSESRQTRTNSRGQSHERRERSQSRNRRTTEEFVPLEASPPLSTLHSRFSSKDLRGQHLATPMVQTIPAGGELIEHEFEEDDRRAWDLRTPEEIEADFQRARSSSRPGGSRLPLARDSPLPVPNIVVERDSPLTRSRQGSSAANNFILEPAIVFNRHGRSGSVGSEVLLDDAEHRSPLRNGIMTPSPPRSSPTKSKSLTKANPTGKFAPKDRASSSSKPRQSSSSNNKRPGTSEGVPRPSTGHRANRPEGEAPWIATMYKPDPSLPPDQQIIPTHAKKMAQEQWEKEGKIGTVYDTNFGLLNTHEFQRPVARTSPSPTEDLTEKQEEGQQWFMHQPLSSPKTDNGRPGTSGGYKTIPTISSPQIPARATPTPLPATSPNLNGSIRLEDPGEDTKRKKGCCCIVM